MWIKGKENKPQDRTAPIHFVYPERTNERRGWWENKNRALEKKKNRRRGITTTTKQMLLLDDYHHHHLAAIAEREGEMNERYKGNKSNKCARRNDINRSMSSSCLCGVWINNHHPQCYVKALNCCCGSKLKMLIEFYTHTHKPEALI